MPVAARLFAPDALRGLIMVLMALDHANNFIAHMHPRAELWSVPLQDYADPLWFVTRFVTHFCAPGFFLLLGVGSAMFSVSRRADGWSRQRIAGYLLLRGAVLVALQFFVENPAWNIGDTGGPGTTVYVGVLFALGVAMMATALLVWLPSWALVVLAVAVVLAIGLFVPLGAPNTGFSMLQRLVLIAGYSDADNVYVLYPALPWLAPTALGVLIGRLLQRDARRAYRIALAMGAVFVALFFVLRLLGGFGNLLPNRGSDWISFFNLVKYPPAPVYLLLTVGVSLLALYLFALVQQARQRLFTPLLAFGRSPLFFYLVHLYLYGLIGLVVAPHGIGLVAMYPYWLLGLLIMFPLCLLYGRFKRQQPPGSIWRLF